jgi:pimeloyl-ACP methyl ester carboxylesterase
MTRATLMLLPGLLCDAAVFEPMLPALASAACCRIRAYHAERTLTTMAARVLADAPPRFALLGHSMGGRVALEVMRAAPGRVERLALLDTGYQARPRDDHGARERDERMALLALARERGMRAMGQRWVQRMVHPGRLDDGALLSTILDMIGRRSADEFAGQIDALLGRPDAREVLQRIDVPTLVLCGRDDGWSPLARHEEIAALVPGSHLAIVEHCGHMCTMEQPSAVARQVLDWLQAPPRTG